ncbi:hypothetical protein D3C73_765480 [compost metagenome]
MNDFVFGHREIVAVQHDQIGQMALGDDALLALFIGEPGVSFGPKAQRRLAVLTLGGWIHA